MMETTRTHRQILSEIAHQAMLDRGLIPDFPPEVTEEIHELQSHPSSDASIPAEVFKDMRNMAWASIDDDDSLDLDQLTVAEDLGDKTVRIYVAIADVDAAAKKGTAIDQHAHHNTTTVYTPAFIFSMLPEVLSTDLTSLKFDDDRPAVVIKMDILADGSLADSDVYRALVRNQAKLAYDSVAAWLENQGPLPAAIAAIPGLAENLILQDRVAQKMKGFRQSHGALSFETGESRPVFNGDRITSVELQQRNRARELVENFMIVANGVTVRFLSAKKFSAIRRVVDVPARWDRIVEIAARHHFTLVDQPDAKALENFLLAQKAADPDSFADLSLSIIKLLGAGEYRATPPGENQPGHFSLAVRDYGHSTAPNRRFTDLVTQRLLKAAITGQSQPYSLTELEEIALHCTQAEDAANKVERQVEKSAAALLLEPRIGESFTAIVTGAADKGTWVRLIGFPVEGKLISGRDHSDVGDRIRVQLVSVDVEKGFIDFEALAENPRPPTSLRHKVAGE